MAIETQITLYIIGYDVKRHFNLFENVYTYKYNRIVFVFFFSNHRLVLRVLGVLKNVIGLIRYHLLSNFWPVVGKVII